MEVSFVKELDFKGKEPVFDSNSCQSPVELRSIEQVADDDDQEENKCEHFTIRGYVAKVRRRDTKICWPLFLPHNQTSDELVSSLPPLPVTKFRWWNCQKCLIEANTPEDVIADGEVIKVQNDGVNTCNISFLVNADADATNLLSGFQQGSEEKILDGKLVEANSSINVINGECSLSLCSGKKENALINCDLTKEGLQIPKGGSGRSEENQNQSSEPTISPNECKKPLGVDINISKADALTSISAHMSYYDSMHLNKKHTKTSDNSMDLPNDINHPDHSSELGNSYEKSHSKKARKVRFLDDIIRSEQLSMSTMVHISSGDAKDCQTKNSNGRSPDTSNWKLQHPENKSHLATQNIQEMPSIEASQNEDSQNEDEENSLMDWLKKVSKKVIAQKGHSENKHLDATVGISSGSSSEQRASRCKLKSALKKENKMSPLKAGWPCLLPQQDSLIAKDESTKLFPAKTVSNRSTGCTVSEKSLHHGPEIQEGTNKKSILSDKKNKAPPVEDRPKVKKKTIKKQKTRSLFEQEGLDDIPMDIVELLAKHQHERCLLNADVAAESMHNLPKMTGNISDGDDSEKRCGEGKALDVLQKNISHQRSHFNQAVEAIHTTTGNNSDANCRLKACDSSNFCKKNLHFDLNQQPTEFLELSEYSGDPLSRPEHPVIVSNRSYSPQNFGLDMKMQASGSCNRNQAIETKISSRKDHDGTSAPLNDTAFRSITRREDADFNYVNVDSHDSCLDQSMMLVGQKTDFHDSHDSKSTCSQLLGKEKAESSIDIHSAATYSFVEAGNACHPRTIKPLNLYANETTSALHLLRLMDQTAGSGASYTNQARSILEYDLNCTDQCEELQGLEFGFREETPKHPWRDGYSDQDQHPWNACKLQHPVPGISCAVSLLNKEIVSQSNNHPTLPGLEARHPVELPLHNFIEKEKPNTSCSAIHTEFGNTKTFAYMGVNSEQMISGLDSFAHSSCSLRSYEIDKAGSSSKERADQPPTSHCVFENCVVNRNPADFTALDEDECMIGINDPRTR